MILTQVILLITLFSPLLGQSVSFNRQRNNRKKVDPKLGLLQTDLGIDPFGSQTSSFTQQNQGHNQNQRPNRRNPCNRGECCCTRRRQCHQSSEAPDIDIRIVTPQGGQTCPRNQVYCCVDYNPPPQNPYCQGVHNTGCCCVGYNYCQGTTDGAGSFDIRLKPSPNTQTRQRCSSNEVWCCAENVIPEPTYPPPKPNPGPAPSGECGYRYPPPQGYRPGDRADFGEIPWNVVILQKRSNLFLGIAALIDPWNVITADHKVFNYTARQIKLRFGDYDLQSTDYEPYPYVERNVARIIHHPNSNVRYNPTRPNLKYNIAVLQLAKRIDFNEYIQPVCLPSYNTYFDNLRCVVAGWGKDSFDGYYQNALKKVQVPILSAYECSQALKRTRLGQGFQFDDHSFICAGGEKRHDACTGDGGAPLVCEVNGRFTVAGLVAWGIGCGEATVPGVYVNVKSFSKWVNDNLYN